MTVFCLSVCRATRSWCGVLWLSWLHWLPADPTKARVQTPLTSTLALQRPCHSACPIPFHQKYWPTWRIVELSAPTGFVCLGRVLPTMLQGQRPLYEHKRWNFVCWSCGLHTKCATKFYISRNKDTIHQVHNIQSMEPPCSVHHVHFLGYT